MIETDFRPKGVCATNIHVKLSDDGSTVEGVEFTRGCTGNLQAISKLVKGMPTDKVIELLHGNTCGNHHMPDGTLTSCADQMTRALAEAQALAGK